MIGIIGAMDIEVALLKKEIQNVKIENYSGIDFYLGKIADRDVVVAKSGVGKVFSAVTAEIMILKYKVDSIINIGVAGSLDDEIGISDVAVAEKVVQHDIDTSAVGDPIGMISGINKVYLPCDKNIIDSMVESAQNLNLKYKKGVIASGDRFIKSDSERKYIVDNFNAISCDMEGASIGQVCYINDVKFCVIRVITDFGNKNDNDDYANAKENSSNICISLVKEFLRIYKE